MALFLNVNLSRLSYNKSLIFNHVRTPQVNNSLLPQTQLTDYGGAAACQVEDGQRGLALTGSGNAGGTGSGSSNFARMDLASRSGLSLTASTKPSRCFENHSAMRAFAYWTAASASSLFAAFKCCAKRSSEASWICCSDFFEAPNKYSNGGSSCVLIGAHFSDLVLRGRGTVPENTQFLSRSFLCLGLQPRRSYAY
jgi:hypothetical protein